MILKIIICLILWFVACVFTACGASLGNSSFGTTSYLREHNRKLEILYGDDMDYHSISDKEELQRTIVRGLK